MRYIFHPGRDVIVGYGSQCDVPLDRPGNPASTSQTARAVLVLRFSGTHWVAIENSPDGMFVHGARMSTIDVRDGQAITIGDPRRGPRLILGVGPAVGPPAPDRPDRPNKHVPTQRTTQRMRLPTSQPPPVGVE
ncbi:MAG: ABC transporter, partial [Mycobacterium sp.]